MLRFLRYNSKKGHFWSADTRYVLNNYCLKNKDGVTNHIFRGETACKLDNFFKRKANTKKHCFLFFSYGSHTQSHQLFNHIKIYARPTINGWEFPYNIFLQFGHVKRNDTHSLLVWLIYNGTIRDWLPQRPSALIWAIIHTSICTTFRTSWPRHHDILIVLLQ